MLGGTASAALSKNSRQSRTGAGWKSDRREFTNVKSILYVKLQRVSEETHNSPSTAEQLDAANELWIATRQTDWRHFSPESLIL